MNKIKSLLFLATLTVASVSFTAQAKETITIGATPVPHVEILEVVKPILAKEGFDLKNYRIQWLCSAKFSSCRWTARL